MELLKEFYSDSVSFVSQVVDFLHAYKPPLQFFKGKQMMDFVQSLPRFRPHTQAQVVIERSIDADVVIDVYPEDSFPPPSPPNELETPYLERRRGSRREEFAFTTRLGEAGISAFTSHFRDMWRWGHFIFATHQAAISNLEAESGSSRHLRWRTCIGLAMLETLKALLYMIAKASSLDELLDYLSAKFWLYCFLSGCHFEDFLEAPLMCEKGRRGLFLAQILGSAASKTNDSFEPFRELAENIMFGTIPDVHCSGEAAKQMINERLKSKVVTEAFMAFCAKFADFQFILRDEEDFYEYARNYLMRTRSFELRKFRAYGWSLPNQYIAVEAFLDCEDEDLILNSIFVVFLHELGHSILRRSARTLREYMQISTPRESPGLPQLNTLSPAWNIVASNDPLLSSIQPMSPLHLASVPGPVTEAGNDLETLLFGSRVQWMTKAIVGFFQQEEVWSLPVALFKEKFAAVHQIAPLAGEPFVNLKHDREGAIHFPVNWCATNRSTRLFPLSFSS